MSEETKHTLLIFLFLGFAIYFESIAVVAVAAVYIELRKQLISIEYKLDRQKKEAQ